MAKKEKKHGLTGKPSNAQLGDAPLTDKVFALLEEGYKAKLVKLCARDGVKSGAKLREVIQGWVDAEWVD